MAMVPRTWRYMDWGVRWRVGGGAPVKLIGLELFQGVRRAAGLGAGTSDSGSCWVLCPLHHCYCIFQHSPPYTEVAVCSLGQSRELGRQLVRSPRGHGPREGFSFLSQSLFQRWAHLPHTCLRSLPWMLESVSLLKLRNKLLCVCLSLNASWGEWLQRDRFRKTSLVYCAEGGICALFSEVCCGLGLPKVGQMRP